MWSSWHAGLKHWDVSETSAVDLTVRQAECSWRLSETFCSGSVWHEWRSKTDSDQEHNTTVMVRQPEIKPTSPSERGSSSNINSPSSLLFVLFVSCQRTDRIAHSTDAAEAAEAAQAVMSQQLQYFPSAENCFNHSQAARSVWSESRGKPAAVSLLLN